MRVYLANMYIEDVCFALKYEVADDQEAELIADENDWEYLGEFMWEEDCPDEVEAMIELMVAEPTRH